MHLTPERVEAQIKKADKLMRVLWRLYSPYRSHRKLIVKASAHIMDAVELLEKLKEQAVEDYKNEMKKPLPKQSIPPGYYNGESEDV